MEIKNKSFSAMFKFYKKNINVLQEEYVKVLLYS